MGITAKTYNKTKKKKKTYTTTDSCNVRTVRTLVSAHSQQQAHESSSSSSCFMADRILISALPPPISQVDH